MSDKPNEKPAECWFFHRWFYFRDIFGEVRWSNGIDVEFVLRPEVCLKCKKVRWVYVRGNL